MKHTLLFLIMAATACLAASADTGNTVLVEAEGFDKTGGWVTDQQSMDQMGSPYLLAHGLGKPVADAVTKVQLPAAGKYRVFVRTRDWVAPWKTPDTPDSKRAKGTPGRFRVLINGKPLETEFGTEGAAWHWQKGGEIEVASKEIEVTLDDLTGFEGRCDAILFTSDKGFTPPDKGKELAQLRRRLLGTEKLLDAGKYDLVVTGGGIAGICAAVSAARHGLKVALIQDRPVLGGNNSSEVRVWLHGRNDNPRYPRLGSIVRELEQKKRAHSSLENTGELYEDHNKLKVVKAEENISLFLSHRVNDAEVAGQRIAAVIAQDVRTGARKRFVGRFFADCTGDGTVGFLAGASYEMTEKGHMGQSNLWAMRDTGKPVSFPRCPWAYDLSEKPFPGRDGKNIGRQLGTWFWESGCFRDPVEDRERCRDNNLRAMYGAWDCLKNVQKLLPNHALTWAAYISGPRESRRLIGDITLNKEHLMQGRKFPDGCVITGWKIDLHLPDTRYNKGFEEDEFITKAHFTGYKTPFYVPYRCFYSRNIENLFMAGRDVSVTHDALGTVRVMRTCGQMGEVVGMAASLCIQHRTTPRGVYEKHFEELGKLMGSGAAVKAGLKIGRADTSMRTGSTHKIDRLPEQLKPLVSVVIDRGDHQSPAPAFSFKIDADAEVFIAVHDRGTCSLPEGWEKTDMKVAWGGKYTDTIYSRTFKAGAVKIPGHDGKEGPNYGLPHMAFVKPLKGKVNVTQPD